MSQKQQSIQFQCWFRSWFRSSSFWQNFSPWQRSVLSECSCFGIWFYKLHWCTFSLSSCPVLLFVISLLLISFFLFRQFCSCHVLLLQTVLISDSLFLNADLKRFCSVRLLLNTDPTCKPAPLKLRLHGSIEIWILLYSSHEKHTCIH